MKTLSNILLSIATIVVFTTAVSAGNVTGMNVFEAGKKAIAADVNANFTAVKAAVDDNNTNIANKQDRVTGSCAAGNSIRAIAANGTVTCEPDTVGSGDITAVYSGSGLSGGGSGGAVTLSVPTAGITAAHIATNAVGVAEIGTSAVGTSEIINGSVTAADTKDEPGLDSASKMAKTISSLSICNTFTDVTSVTLTAPAAGYAVVMASGILDGMVVGQHARVVIDDATGGTTYDSSFYHWYESGSATGYQDYKDFAMQVVYSVNAGSKTFYLKACKESATSAGFIDTDHFVVLYFPTRY